MKTKDLNKKPIVRDSRCQPSCTCDVAFSSVDRGATCPLFVFPSRPHRAQTQRKRAHPGGTVSSKAASACMYVCGTCTFFFFGSSTLRVSPLTVSARVSTRRLLNQSSWSHGNRRVCIAPPRLQCVGLKLK